MDDAETLAWKNTDVEDLWIFDKLILSKKLGYTCGPVGVDVPNAQNYIVRPCVNILGMSIQSEILYIEKETDFLTPGHFWCEVFEGRHISVDYEYGNQILAVEGFRKSKKLWKFYKWEKVNEIIPLPAQFMNLTRKYRYINIEYIDHKPIEIHLRTNPDFAYGNTLAYPVWNDKDPKFYDPQIPNLKYVESPEFRRIGFWID